MQSIDSKVLNRIRGTGRGSVFTPGTFLDLGSRDAIDKVLSRSISLLVPRETLPDLE